MFICLKCKKKYKESDLTIETYGEDFDLEKCIVVVNREKE